MSTQTAAEAWAEYQAAKQSTPASKPKRKRCGACATVYEGDRCPECHPVTRPTSPEPAPFEAEPVAEAVPPPETEPRRECAACGRLYVPPPRSPGMSGYPPRRCPACIEAGLQRGGVIRRRKLANVSATATATATSPEPAPEPEPRTPEPAPAPAGNDPIDTILQAVASVRPGITVRFVYVEMSNT